MDYRQFLDHADVWGVAEAVDLLLGMKPLRPDEPDRSEDLRELAYRAIDAGTLPCIGKKKDRRVSPAEFAKWAAGKGFEIPANGNPALLAHGGLRESDAASRGGGEVSAGAHPGYGPWQPPRLPPDYWLRNPKIGPLPERYERPRQCLIEEKDAISFSQARAILEPRWNTTPTEIRFWLVHHHPGLHAFDHRRKIGEPVYIGHTEWGFWRCEPGLAGSTRPCSRGPFIDATCGTADETDSEALTWYKFSRSEVEAFDPAKNEYDASAPIEYLTEHWFNPSGRLLTHEQAVAFMAQYATHEEDAVNAIEREYQCGNLIGLAAPGPLWNNMIGLKAIWPVAIAETWFLEAQIIGLARSEFGADVTRWDAASRPEATEEVSHVLYEETFSLEETKIKLRERLNANDYEIERWILDGWIQAYRHHRFRDDNSCSKAEPFRYGDDGEPERQIFPLRRFLREEVERFDPSTPSLDDLRPSDYPEFPIIGLIMEDDPRKKGYNPSGRWVSFRQAVDFLGAAPGATIAGAERLIRRGVETSGGGIVHIYGPDEDDPPLEEGYFCESQIVAIATVHFGRPFDGWDAITRPHPAAPLDDECLPIPAVAAVGDPPEHQPPQQPREPEPTAAGASGTEFDAPDTGGMVAWQAVVIESWPTIVAAHGLKPAARKVLKWIKDHGPRDTIPTEQPDRNSLHWIDFTGNPHTVTLATVGTRLSEWRKNGIIPG
jgi:hypothetical protein